MYLDFYQLQLKPFQISTDPRFLWLGEKHEEALAVLKYAIRDNSGFLLLTGDVGTGKTTLLNALIHDLDDDVRVALVTDPGLAKLDFFNYVADAFNLDRTFRSKGQFLIFMKKYLLELQNYNKQALLIIDESQNLTQSMLEEVRLLSNIETATTKLINIFFVGQIEFNDIILRPRNRAIRQRITVSYDISKLNESEIGDYIRYRLKVAGSREPIFTPDAMNEIYQFSKGYPRLINIICNQALLTGYVREKRQIGSAIVAECATELKISGGIVGVQNQAIPESGKRPAAGQPGPSSPKSQTTDKAIDGKPKFNKSAILVVGIILALLIGLEATLFRNRQESANINGSKRSVQPTEAATALPKAQSATQIKNHAQNTIPLVGQSNQANSDQSGSKGSSDTSTADQSKVTEPDQAPTTSSIAAVAPLRSTDAKTQLSLADIKKLFGEYPEVKFGFNSNTLDNEDYYLLELIARYIAQKPSTALILRGYTDRSGVRTYNLKLAEFRADMVKTYLVGKGVPADSITTIAVGPDPDGPDGTTVPYDGQRRKVVIEFLTPAS
ncbi:hypothetical protein DSCW_50960 [Desulfosarcina widdelii]|uniref:OmpA-like domain-containing protein n=1 Tax=Desulfosarcina widdelii TaxID=947919 RepID=A0A5K7ZBY4_9BACT|nr:AAA family ATPase [Desulfosarcina widdelii]BBO77679.1 hypothetical protein DSCW_50960 [Desulfosarcina widdelii]